MEGAQEGAVYKIVYAPSFWRSFRKLNSVIQARCIEREHIFLRDPFHPQLHTHKLHGELKDFWAYRVDHQYRLIFKFMDGGFIMYYKIGTHDIYNG